MARDKLTAALLLLLVFITNLGETALEGHWSPTVTSRGLEFASALHWFEGGSGFENHDVTNPIAVYGYSVAYFLLFPVLAIGVAWATARRPDPRAFRMLAFSLATAVRAQPPVLPPLSGAGAMGVSRGERDPALGSLGLTTHRCLQADERTRQLLPEFPHVDDRCPVLCCFVYRVGFRWTTIPIGAMVLISTYSLGVHWVGDVIAGTAIGVVSVAVACHIVDRAIPCHRLAVPYPFTPVITRFTNPRALNARMMRIRPKTNP